MPNPIANVDRVHGARAFSEPVRRLFDEYWQAYGRAAESQGISAVSHNELRAVLERVWIYSDFVAQSCSTDPELLNELLASGDMNREYAPFTHARLVAAALAGVVNANELHQRLRELRRREMVRIAWRDLAGWAPLAETLRDLSLLADACVSEALRVLHGWQCAEMGTPFGERSAQPQQLVVLAMGKLGAHELNFSSDIDLIFAYPEEGETRGGRREVSNEEFFSELGRRLIAALDNRTPLGFVFRVDMRLRPYGDVGPLAMSFDAMEDYYQAHGRDWERYAMIKARCIAGDFAAGETLLRTLQPFVYRRYLDFGAFAALRDMKQLIADQVARKGMENNVKLGPGGIREVEFVGQVFQLIRGGREKDLQERSILTVLARLAQKQYLPDYAERELRAAYVFLRHAENRLQALRDQQTQELPHSDDDRLRIALAMGFETWEGFHRVLQRHMATVHNHFEQVFVAPQSEQAAAKESELAVLWRGALGEAQAVAALERLGFRDAPEALNLLTQTRQSSNYRLLTVQGRERFDKLMPLVLGSAGAVKEPQLAFTRFMKIMESVGRRTAYYSLLVENPLALSQLMKLCAASSWLATFVGQHPLLMDELLDPRSLYAPLTKAALADELRRDLEHVNADDQEQQMEVLRQFAHANMLRVAAADVSNAMPLMIVSDHLTEIAEVVLDKVLELAWQYLTERHGVPRYRKDGTLHAAGFAIVGYGKLGGIELGYGSDLDLVFLHDSEGEEERTDGAKPLDNPVFFARLAQRIIHMLGTHTPSGTLYEVDVRLRPSGAAGLLVSSLLRFGDYQRTEAWTWEHQALVRARVVAGSSSIAARFARIRGEVLAGERDPEQLRREVREMRAKMRAELGSRDPALFDIKQDFGGIADIEFMVQYGVLRWAHAHPPLLDWPDNIRLLETLASCGALPAADAAFLADAYRTLRSAVHRLTLQDRSAQVSGDQFADIRQRVQAIWRGLMEAESPTGC